MNRNFLPERNRTPTPARTPPEACPNCGIQLAAQFAYCPACGQGTDRRIDSFNEISRDFLEEYFSFDSKVFKSLLPLLYKPGFLTNEYVQGRRARYIPPLRMYLTISLLAFLMLAVNKPSRTRYEAASTEITADEMAEIRKNVEADNAVDALTGDGPAAERFWNDFFDSTLPKLFFIMVPFYALILAALYRRRNRYYVEHLVFSLHFHSFVFVALLFYMLASSYVFRGNASVNAALMGLLAAVILVYLFAALKKVYGQNHLKTIAKFSLLAGGYSITFIVFSLLALFAYYSFA